MFGCGFIWGLLFGKKLEKEENKKIPLAPETAKRHTSCYSVVSGFNGITASEVAKILEIEVPRANASLMALLSEKLVRRERLERDGNMQWVYFAN